jgi:predicted transposase YbfD/YdcC
MRTDAEHMGTVMRGHLSSENGLHWSLDVANGEDPSRMREGKSAEDFPILRGISLNLIGRDKTVKAGVKALSPPSIELRYENPVLV